MYESLQKDVLNYLTIDACYVLNGNPDWEQSTTLYDGESKSKRLVAVKEFLKQFNVDQLSEIRAGIIYNISVANKIDNDELSSVEKSVYEDCVDSNGDAIDVMSYLNSDLTFDDMSEIRIKMTQTFETRVNRVFKSIGFVKPDTNVVYEMTIE